MPVARDVADQIGAIDALRELTLDVIAALDLNAAYIRSGWRINFGPDEETALDQLWHRRAFHQHLEDVAEAAPIPTTRGCVNAGEKMHRRTEVIMHRDGPPAGAPLSSSIDQPAFPVPTWHHLSHGAQRRGWEE